MRRRDFLKRSAGAMASTALPGGLGNVVKAVPGKAASVAAVGKSRFDFGLFMGGLVPSGDGFVSFKANWIDELGGFAFWDQLGKFGVSADLAGKVFNAERELKPFLKILHSSKSSDLSRERARVEVSRRSVAIDRFVRSKIKLTPEQIGRLMADNMQVGQSADGYAKFWFPFKGKGFYNISDLEVVKSHMAKVGFKPEEISEVFRSFFDVAGGFNVFAKHIDDLRRSGDDPGEVLDFLSDLPGFRDVVSGLDDDVDPDWHDSSDDPFLGTKERFHESRIHCFSLGYKLLVDGYRSV